MNPALQGYTAAVAEAAGPAALGGLAADLEAIEQLVLANAQLRAALTDTAVPGPARRAVVLDLLDGKVSPAARRLAAFASMARCRSFMAGGRSTQASSRRRFGSLSVVAWPIAFAKWRAARSQNRSNSAGDSEFVQPPRAANQRGAAK